MTQATIDTPVQPNKTQTQAPARLKEAPVESGFPGLGIIPALLLDAPEEIVRIAVKHTGEIPRVRIGPISVHLLTHPDHLQHVLQENWRNYTRNSQLWTSLRRAFGEGLLFSEGDLWKKRRRMMQPLFLNKHLAALTDTTCRVVQQYVGRFAGFASSGQPIDMVGEMSGLAMALTLEGLFGLRSEQYEKRAVQDAIRDGQKINALHALLSGFPAWLPRPREAEFQRHIKTIEDLVQKMICEVRRSPERPPSDILTLLVRARDEQTNELLDDKGLRDELFTLLAGANDTTSLTLAWLWYALAQNPEMEMKVRAEIVEVIGDRPPTIEAFGKLAYTKRFIQETMRRYRGRIACICPWMGN